MGQALSEPSKLIIVSTELRQGTIADSGRYGRAYYGKTELRPRQRITRRARQRGLPFSPSMVVATYSGAENVPAAARFVPLQRELSADPEPFLILN